MPRRTPRAPDPANLKGLARYWIASQQPLQCLIFLAPLIVFYEVGTIIWAIDPQTRAPRVVTSRILLHQFFEWFGVTGYYLPGLVVVVVLLAWHIVKRDPWRLEPRTYPLMLAESIALALPLIVLLQLINRQFIPAASLPAGGDVKSYPLILQFLFGAGAAIYEELLFRLIGIALLHLIFVDALRLPDRVGTGITIALTSVIFALHHFINPQDNPFNWIKLLLLTLAGGYFAVIYILRGFGVVAGTHAIYDMVVVLMTATR